MWIQQPHAAHDHSGNVIAPQHPSGLAWAYEVVEPARRLYAIDATSALAELIEGHPAAGDPAGQLQARARHARTVAAQLVVSHRSDHLGALTTSELDTLREAAQGPVDLEVWNCPVPLVVLNCDYAPYTSAAIPRGNVQLLNPSDPEAYLASLAEAGVLTAHTISGL